MKYFGPLHYAPDKQIWCDMVPPPSEHYPAMLQVCLSVGELGPRLPIESIIPAIKDWRRLNLCLAVEEMESFEIAWDQEYASDWSGEQTVIDLPGSGGEEANDGADNKDMDTP